MGSGTHQKWAWLERWWLRFGNIAASVSCLPGDIEARHVGVVHRWSYEETQWDFMYMERGTFDIMKLGSESVMTIQEQRRRCTVGNGEAQSRVPCCTVQGESSVAFLILHEIQLLCLKTAL